MTKTKGRKGSGSNVPRKATMALNDIAPLIWLWKKRSFEAEVNFLPPTSEVFNELAAYRTIERCPQNIEVLAGDASPTNLANDAATQISRQSFTPAGSMKFKILRFDFGKWANSEPARHLYGVFSTASVEALIARWDFQSIPKTFLPFSYSVRKKIHLVLTFKTSEKELLVQGIQTLLDKSPGVTSVIIAAYNTSNNTDPIPPSALLKGLKRLTLSKVEELVFGGNGFSPFDNSDKEKEILKKFKQLKHASARDVILRGNPASSNWSWRAGADGQQGVDPTSGDSASLPTRGENIASRSVSFQTPRPDNPAPFVDSHVPAIAAPVFTEEPSLGSTPQVQRTSGFVNMETRRDATDPILKEEISSVPETIVTLEHFINLIFRDMKLKDADMAAIKDAIKAYIQTPNVIKLIRKFCKTVEKEKETAMHAVLFELLNVFSNIPSLANSKTFPPRAYRFVNLPEAPLTGSVANARRKPDGVLVPINLKDPVSWSQTGVVFECKLDQAPALEEREEDNDHDEVNPVDSIDPAGLSKRTRNSLANAASAKKKVRVCTSSDTQLASYMLEVRSCLGIRRYTFGCLVRGTGIQLQCCDSTGIVKSPFVDLQTDPEAVALIAWGLAHASREVLGFDPAFKPPSTGEGARLHSDGLFPESMEGWSYNQPGMEKMTIVNPIHIRWALIGRLTTIYAIKYKKKLAALKLSWTFQNRPPEGDIILAIATGLRNEGKSTEGLPTVLAQSQGTASNACFRRFLGANGALVPDHLVRKQEILVMEKLESLSLLSTTEYAGPFSQIVHTLTDLHAIGVFHRDIHPGNLMLRRHENGKLSGVLIDFSYALVTGPTITKSLQTKLDTLQASGITGQERSASPAFLGIEALSRLRHTKEPLPAIARNDLEPAFNVFVHQAVTFPQGLNGPGVDHKILEAWFSPKEALGAKHLLYSQLKADGFGKRSTALRKIIPELHRIATAFLHGSLVVDGIPDALKTIGNETWVTMGRYLPEGLLVEIFDIVAKKLAVSEG